MVGDVRAAEVLPRQHLPIVTGLTVHVAGRTLGKCANCNGLIKPGHEYAIEPWSNGGGFDHFHVECPALDDHADRIAKPIKTQVPR